MPTINNLSTAIDFFLVSPPPEDEDGVARTLQLGLFASSVEQVHSKPGRFGGPQISAGLTVDGVENQEEAQERLNTFLKYFEEGVFKDMDILYPVPPDYKEITIRQGGNESPVR